MNWQRFLRIECLKKYSIKSITYVASSAAMLYACGTQGAEFPERPVRLIVPYAPGAGQDITGRLLAQRLTDAWGQQVVVDNRPGAGSNIGSEIGARAPADGYTLLLANEAMAINATLTRKLAYDPLRDLAAVSLIVVHPRIFVVHPAVPATNIKELVAFARTKPGGVSYGSSGVGTGPHLAAALLASMAKVEMTHVPYKGVAPAMTDLLGGQIQLIVSTVLSAHPHIQSGKLRALAVTTEKRSAALPNVPTVAESGMPGYEATAWSMLMVPSQTPRALVARIHTTAAKAIDNAEVRKRYAAEGGEAVGSSPDVAGKYLTAEIQRWAKVIKEAGLRGEQ
jgi:tripartite-type tricarboxylate transporter receptor subunit TctC